MRRIATATCIIGALALIGQGAALAQGHHRRSHHARAHRVRHTHGHARFEHFTPANPGGGSTEKTEKGPESAGKVVSYEKGVLTIALNNGPTPTVAGAVTAQTRIKCVSSTAKIADFGGQGGREDGGDDDNQGMGGMQASCGPSALEKGAMVAEALLLVSPTGAQFVEVVLIVQSPATTEKSRGDDDEFGREGGAGGGGDNQGGRQGD
jgi:hypothetical protein